MSPPDDMKAEQNSGKDKTPPALEFECVRRPTQARKP